MAASSSTQKRSGSPCGCGGSGASKTSQAGCGGNCKCGGNCGGGCSTCQGDGYSRPKFFAGQLLTEDDLQQLSDYVVAKNRLHALHLFGSGVACGLEVTCYPCGGGKVMIDPGYALDCCGNDIVISCAQELDIIQMIRDLRRKQNGGVDCGDPCAGASPAILNRSADVTPSECFKYCLYVNYCEQASDPVSPYSTGDACGSQTCETTRVREGFRFELRCPDPTESEPEICKRIHDCLGDAASMDAYRKNALQLQKRGAEILDSLDSMHAARARTLPKNFLNDLARHTTDLTTKLTPRTTKSRKATQPLAEAQSLVESTLAVASDLALFAIQAPAAQPQGKSLDLAKTVLKQAVDRLTDSHFQALFPTALEQTYAASLADTSSAVLDALAAAAPTPNPIAGGAAPPPPVAPAPQPVNETMIRMLAYGVSFGIRLQNQMVTDTDSLRAQLLFRLEQEAMKTRCDLYDTVNRAPKLQNATTSDIRMEAVNLAGQTSLTLGRTFLDMERACFCNALNPPCPSCDDPGVLLACITVADCKVKDICNLDRQFVLSPVNLRYWIPEITTIGRALEKACCPSACPDPKHSLLSANGELDGPAISAAAGSHLDYGAMVFRYLQNSCPDRGPVRYGLQSLGEIASSRIASRAAHSQGGPAADLSAELADTRAELERLRNEHEALAVRLDRLDKKKP